MIARALCLAFGLLLLAGCKPQVDPPQTEVPDDTYYSEFSYRGQWQVRFSGNVSIEVDKSDGSVNVYGVPYRDSNNDNVYPDVKVSGDAVFRVHDAHRVKADDGTQLYVYSSGLAKVGHTARVHAYDTNVLTVWDGQVEEAHGTSQVQKLPAPEPAQSAQPAQPAAPPPANPPAQPN